MTLLNSSPAARTAEPASPAAGLSPWLAGLWSISYLGLAGLHLVRDTAAPWLPTPVSVLGSMSSTGVSILIVVLGLLGLAALALRVRTPRVAGWVLVGTGLVVALVLADSRTLSFLGYLPMILIGLMGVGPAADVTMSDMGPPLASLGESVGGLALVLTGAAVLRGVTHSPGWPVALAARACRWAVAVAIAVPAFYALTRVAWALDLPLGVSRESLDELGDGRYAGLGLALAALVGCVLTAGLAMRWGEVFWSWLPVLGGRPVPVGMAVIPSVFVGSVVFSAGLAFWRLLVVGEIGETPGDVADWAAWVPILFWPLWGVGLAVAGLAYSARRAGGFRDGAGAPPQPPKAHGAGAPPQPPSSLGLPWAWGDTGTSLAPPVPPTYDGLHLVRSVPVSAAPEVVFAWLRQLKLAPYSYDLLDNWGRRSPRHLVEGLSVEVGTSIMDIFTVSALVPDRLLELTLTDPGALTAFGPLVCSYQTVPQVDGTILRCDLFLTPRTGAGRIRAYLLAWGDLVMMRKQLLTLAALSERPQPVQTPSSQAVVRTER